MKIMHILIPVLVAGISVSATGETRKPAEIKKPLTHWTCREFIALGHEYQPRAVYWASAYAQGGAPEVSQLDMAGTEKITPGIVQDCEREPDSSFWQKLKAAWDSL